MYGEAIQEELPIITEAQRYHTDDTLTDTNRTCTNFAFTWEMLSREQRDVESKSHRKTERIANKRTAK